jgi:hypothetical protein
MKRTALTLFMPPIVSRKFAGPDADVKFIAHTFSGSTRI